MTFDQLMSLQVGEHIDDMDEETAQRFFKHLRLQCGSSCQTGGGFPKGQRTRVMKAYPHFFGLSTLASIPRKWRMRFANDSRTHCK